VLPGRKFFFPALVLALFSTTNFIGGDMGFARNAMIDGHTCSFCAKFQYFPDMFFQFLVYTIFARGM
jgi:hypothetical protein